LQTYRLSSGGQDKNLVLRDVQSGFDVHQLSHKNISKANWPSFQLSEDEAFVVEGKPLKLMFLMQKTWLKEL